MHNRRIAERRLGSGRLIQFERGYIHSDDDLETPAELEFELDATPAERARLLEQLVRRREALHAELGHVDPTHGRTAARRTRTRCCRTTTASPSAGFPRRQAPRPAP